MDCRYVIGLLAEDRLVDFIVIDHNLTGNNFVTLSHNQTRQLLHWLLKQNLAYLRNDEGRKEKRGYNFSRIWDPALCKGLSEFIFSV
jgi:hypothetical protein